LTRPARSRQAGNYRSDSHEAISALGQGARRESIAVVNAENDALRAFIVAGQQHVDNRAS
jgi:hypothetical protein